MTIQQELLQFRKANNLALDGGENDTTFSLIFNLFTLKLPNFKFRKKAIHIHDIQHLLYKCDTSWFGESFIAGWEIGTEIWKHFPIGFISLWATGFSLLNYPKQVLKGYKAGLQCKGIIDLQISKDKILKLTLKDIKHLITKKNPAKFNWILFSFWCLLSLIVFLFPLLITLVLVIIYI